MRGLFAINPSPQPSPSRGEGRLAFLLLFLLSYSLPPTHYALASSGTYVDSSIGDATYLNPILATDSASNDINGLVFNGLVKYDKDLKIVGDLAESYEVKNNGLKIIFHLRKNARWHDGMPFTSRDVRYTFDALRDPKTRTPYTSDFELVRSLDTPDDKTVVVNYSKPFAPGLQSWGMGILPAHLYQGTDINTNLHNRSPIGTGPFIFKEWKTDQKIVLERNDHYFEGPVGLEQYIYRIIPDQSVQFLELRNGSIDAMTLTPDQYKAYDRIFRRYNKFRYPSFQYVYFAFNLDHPLFKDPLIRQAFAYAINKKEMIQGLLLGLGQPATGPFVPTSWAYNAQVPGYEYDPKKAAELLAKAGWKEKDSEGWLIKGGKRFEFTLMTNQGNKLRELACQVIQEQLKTVGIKADIRILEWSTFIHQYVDKRNFDAIVLGWNLARDPDAYSIWHSSQIGEGKYNFVGYRNAEVDQLLVEGRETFDLKKRTRIYRRIHALLAADLPYLFLYVPDSLPVVHKRIVGPEIAPAGLGWNFREWNVNPEYVQ